MGKWGAVINPNTFGNMTHPNVYWSFLNSTLKLVFIMANILQAIRKNENKCCLEQAGLLLFSKQVILYYKFPIKDEPCRWHNELVVINLINFSLWKLKLWRSFPPCFINLWSQGRHISFRMVWYLYCNWNLDEWPQKLIKGKYI